jgi:hypothetical protein
MKENGFNGSSFVVSFKAQTSNSTYEQDRQLKDYIIDNMSYCFKWLCLGVIVIKGVLPDNEVQDTLLLSLPLCVFVLCEPK